MKLAFRVAILGSIALAAFSIIFFRLWFLQILSGDNYLSQSLNNQVREIRVEAPRGKIVDRNGSVLVDNRTALQVKLVPQRLPQDLRRRNLVFERLARALKMRTATIRKRVERQLKLQPYSGATIRTDVPHSTVYYLLENQVHFPGLQVERVFLRRYPKRAVGGHLFGTVGEVSKEQLEEKDFEGAKLGDRVGQSGLEVVYDRFLRGKNGASRIQVDAFARPQRELSVRDPVAGSNLRLSIELRTQKAAENAIDTGVRAFGRGSAAVAIDPRDGEIIALASHPGFDPNIFAKGISRAKYRELISQKNGAPLANRAIQGLYPTGSTFKLITATAALESGLITPGSVIVDGGSITVGGITFKNAGDASYGGLTLVPALEVSSDVFFYTVGLRANQRGGDVIQKWARRLGLGHKTGIDLPGEIDGLIPTPAWRNRLYKEKKTDRPWSSGDNVNLAVGQGDLQANPLQMAVAYSAIANGGYIVKPHIGRRVESSSGRVVEQIQPPSRRKLSIKPETRRTIMQGLQAAANGPRGTSTAVFKGFKVPVAGKTGTAERPGQGDQAWYCVMAPYPSTEIVVCTTIEGGGFGAESAAPAARKILASYFRLKDKKPTNGTAQD